MARRMPTLSRRRLLSLTSTGLLLPAGLGLSRRGLAAPASSDHRFLFVFCTGGWDHTECLAPMLGTVVDNDPELYQAEAHGIPYVTTDQRPDVAAFFEAWGDRLALVHGIEARSVAHDVCLRLILTGTPRADGNDWPAILASQGGADLLLPMVHISGPSYTASLAGEVVRVGSHGQLAELLSGEALSLSTLPVSGLPDDALALADQLVTARLESAAAEAGRGRAARLAQDSVLADQRLGELFTLAQDLDLAGGDDFVEQAAIVAELFERGLARTGMVEFYGTMGLSWDTHSVHALQGQHFNTLMGGLSQIMGDLAARSGTSGGSLLDQTTVVVMSEMGRYPKFNSRQGKDHWTYTSAMLLGAGVNAGAVVGGYDAEDFTGKRVDVDTGQLREDGTALVPSHLGATLVAMAGHDPTSLVGDYAPITAVMT